ncbi:ubiquitin carboxyl-terminal hydrolase 42-like [Antennarius striatus]|uniref:ubiquitin carboxyl-terminal hydrolase 42-like n=1 Tax=Antennarius striatus TaxID=241820 RepID=UPI0035B149D8
MSLAVFAVTNKDDIDLPLMALFPLERLSMKWTHVHSVGAGLQNIANTCYMNSTLQCLTYTPPLTNFLMTREHSSECNSPKDKFCMMCTLEKHIVKAFSNSGKAIYPIDVLWKLPYIGGHFGFLHQEDAHEFLQATINALQDSCLNGMELDSATETKTFIHQVFGGLFRSRVTCLNCNRVSDTFEPFTDIPVDVERTDNISNALVDFVAPEQLDGESAYCCSKCQQMVTATKECNIYRSSNILTIMLKRFSAILGQKIGKYVEYPEYLDMEPYMSDNNIGPQHYSLYAVLIHSGDNVYAGHYYCYTKASDGRWYFMDDCLVTESDIKTVLRQHAYILFYAKSSEEETTKGGGQMRLNTVISDQASTEPNVMPQDNATIHHCTYAVNLSLSPQMTEESHSDTVPLSGVTSVQDCEESKTSDMECSRCTAYSQESRKMCHPQHGYTWDSQNEHDHQSQVHPPLQDRSKLDESLQELSHQDHSEWHRSKKMRSHRKIVHRFQPYKHSHRHKSQQDLSNWTESNHKRSEWDKSYKMRLHLNLVHQNWPNKHWSNRDDSRDNLSHKSFPHQNRSNQDESYQTQSQQNRVYRPYQHWSRQENSAQDEAHQDLKHHKRSDSDRPKKMQMHQNPVHSFQQDHRSHSGKSYQARSNQDEVHRQNLSHQYKSYQTQSHQNRVDRPYLHQSPRAVSHQENSAQDKAHQNLTTHNRSDRDRSNRMGLHRNPVHRFQSYQRSHSGKSDQACSDLDEIHRDPSYHKL